MSYPRRVVDTPTSQTPSVSSGHWTVRRSAPTPAPRFQMRSYDILWAAANGDIEDRKVTAPDLPIFENAFCAFARGALIQTIDGPVAVEDLLPGDYVETVGGDPLPIKWIGSMAIPAAAQQQDKLFRVSADAFGFGRPAPDLMLGRSANYLMRSSTLSAFLGTREALAPIAAMEDGVNVVPVSPYSTVRTYHLCLPSHHLIRVNGVELESYHPGANIASQLPGELRERFQSLFPHLRELGEFGAMAYPRLSMRDLEKLSAA